MTTAAATAAGRTRAVSNPWGPRASTGRALSLLQGGVVGAHALGLPAVGLALALGGPSAGGWAAVAAAVVLVFFVIGQGVQVAVAERDPMVVMGASVGSFVLRAVALGLLLWLGTTHPAAVTTFARVPVFAATAATVGGWLAGEIVAYRRLRIPVYDTEYVAPDERSAGEGERR